MKKCEKCNHEVLDEMKYCPDCGLEIVNNPKPAGFWIRVVASLIDSLVFIPIILLSFINMGSIKSVFVFFLIAIPGLIYKPFMESYYGATLGKMALGLKVIGKNGEKLNLQSAYIRFIPFLISSIVAFIGIYILFSMPEFKTASGILEIGRLEQKNPVKPIKTIIDLLIFVDCVAVAFTYRKRAFHDMLAKSFCVYKN